MTLNMRSLLRYGIVVLIGLTLPLSDTLEPYTFQLAVLWIMILFALTWDIMGGQMGYFSFGNIFFFGAGMYICTLIQIGLYYDVAEYTAHFGAVPIHFTFTQYFTGIFVGLAAAGIASVAMAVILGSGVFGLRGHYFAIGTLGLAIAAAEVLGGVDYVGGGGGITIPIYPGDPDDRSLFFYYLCFVSAVATFAFLRWLYSTRFGLAINSIRDDEEKAEGMGIHTKRYKTVAWAISAFFLGICGGIFGNMVGFIEPLEVAFPWATYGVFMVLMVILGGKGTLWGPVIGAVVFHIIKELTWTYLLGWQWVALGTLIIVNVIFFQQGIVGWARDKWPERFGLIVDESMAAAPGREATARREPAE